MPGKSGLEVAASVSRKHPELKILIFTMHSGKTLHGAAREAGAHGVVQKSYASRDLIRAIETLIDGGNSFQRIQPHRPIRLFGQTSVLFSFARLRWDSPNEVQV
jgi:DNA-binding NarL/FixJ family response regulator